MSVIKNNRDFVVPGAEIVKSMDYVPGRNCFRDGESIIAKRLGLASIDGRVASVIPLSGVYIPRIGDMVIGKIAEIQSSGWILNINSCFDAYLPLSNVNEFIDTKRTPLDKYYAIGDVLYVKVVVVNGDSIHVSMQDSRSRKLYGGRITTISSAKVPRLIGKNGSMINLIKEGTNSRIRVGQNGFVFIEGGDINLAIKAIDLIEDMSHTDGLTDKISDILKIKPPKQEAPKEVPKAAPEKKVEPKIGQGELHEEKK